MDPEDKRFLKKFYLDDIKKLQQLLNRKLPWSVFNDEISE